MFAVRCLLACTAALTAAAAGQPPLEAELAEGGLNEPHALSDILRDVGLHSIGDVQHLNAPEQLELSESLRAAGVILDPAAGCADFPMGSHCQLLQQVRTKRSGRLGHVRAAADVFSRAAHRRRKARRRPT